jgi:hypothetical protein
MVRPMGAQCLAEYGYHRFSNWNRRHARSAARFFTLGNVFCQSGCRLRPRFTESFSWPERGGLKADRPVSDAAVKLPFGPLISLFTAVRSQTVPTRSNRFGNWKPILRSRAKNRTCSSPYFKTEHYPLLQLNSVKAAVVTADGVAQGDGSADRYGGSAEPTPVQQVRGNLQHVST